MKKILMFFIITIFGITLAACNGDGKEPSLTVLETSITIKVNGTQKLTVEVKDVEGTPTLNFVSSVPSVAEVSEDGTITGLAKGSTNITITVEGYSKLSKTVSVTVGEADPEITVSDTTVTIKENEIHQLNVELKNVEGTPVVNYVSSNPSVADVAEDGAITGVAKGSVDITITVEGYESLTRTVSVTVEEELYFNIELQQTTIKEGEKTKIFTSTNIAKPSYKYTSSDTSVVTVNPIGDVTAVGYGEAEVTVTLVGFGEKKVTIKVEYKDYQPSELNTLLEQLLDNYHNTLNGSIKATTIVDDGGTELVTTSETIYNYNEDGSLDSLMYKGLTNDGIDIHAYVKEGLSYVFTNGTTKQQELTAQEEAILKSQYNHVLFLKPFTKIYKEAKFYEALSLGVRTENIVEFTLDLTEYTGTIINVSDALEVTIIITFTNDVVSKVEIISVQENQTSKLIMEYRGYVGEQVIDFPDEF